MDIDDCVLSHSSSSGVPLIPKTAVDAYLYLLQNSKYSDVTFIVGKEQKKIPCHSVFLTARSTVFEAGLRYKLKEEKPVQIVVSDVSSDLFESFLKFIYGDFLEATSTDPLLQLLELGLKYKVELLSEKCVSKLCNNDMTPENAIKTLYAAKKFKLEELRAFAIDQLVASLGTLGKEPELLEKLDEATVRCILERNDLPLKEVEVFNFLVNWGKTKVKVKGNLQELRDTLGSLLLLIRFPIMSPEEFGGSVASSGLLPSKTLIQLFIYFTATGDAWERAARSLEYSTKLRDGIEDTVEAEASFYSNEHNLGERRTETCEVSYLRECIKFTINHPPSSSVSPVKTKVLLNSITLQWPERRTYCQGKPSDFASETEKTITIAGPHIFGGKFGPSSPKRGRYRGNTANPSYTVDLGRGRPITVIPDSNEATYPRVSTPSPSNQPANQLHGFRFNFDLCKQVDSSEEAPMANIQEIFQSRPFSSAGINPLFRLQLKQILERPGKDDGDPITSMVTVFSANSLVMKEGETVSIEVNPPVELLDGKRNLLLLEEESFIPFSGGQYRYAAVGNLQTSVDVKLKNCSLQISDIHRNDPKPFVSVADKFSDLPVIKTLNITYSRSTSKLVQR